jgi:hypothetical protein
LDKHPCHKCGKPIKDAYVRDSGKNYHPACFSDKAGEVERKLKLIFGGKNEVEI